MVSENQGVGLGWHTPAPSAPETFNPFWLNPGRNPSISVGREIYWVRNL
jgi:hypothetical protein